MTSPILDLWGQAWAQKKIPSSSSCLSLVGGSAFQHRTFLKGLIGTYPVDHVLVLSMHEMAPCWFPDVGHMWFRYMDIGLLGTELDNVESFVTHVLQQHKQMSKSTPSMSSSSPSPVSSRYAIHPSYYKHETSILTRLANVKLLVVLDVMSWPLHMVEHLDLLMSLAHEKTLPFGGQSTVFDLHLYMPPPMGTEMPAVAGAWPAQTITQSTSWPVWTAQTLSLRSQSENGLTTLYFSSWLAVPGGGRSPPPTYDAVVDQLMLSHPYNPTTHQFDLHVFPNQSRGQEERDDYPRRNEIVEHMAMTLEMWPTAHAVWPDSVPQWTYTWTQNRIPSSLMFEGVNTTLPSHTQATVAHTRAVHTWLRDKTASVLLKKKMCPFVLKENLVVFVYVRQHPSLMWGQRCKVLFVHPQTNKLHVEACSNNNEYIVDRISVVLYPLLFPHSAFSTLSTRAYPVVPALAISLYDLYGLPLDPDQRLVLPHAPPMRPIRPPTLYFALYRAATPSNVIIRPVFRGGGFATSAPPVMGYSSALHQLQSTLPVVDVRTCQRQLRLIQSTGTGTLSPSPSHSPPSVQKKTLKRVPSPLIGNDSRERIRFAATDEETGLPSHPEVSIGDELTLDASTTVAAPVHGPQTISLVDQVHCVAEPEYQQ